MSSKLTQIAMDFGQEPDPQPTPPAAGNGSGEESTRAYLAAAGVGFRVKSLKQPMAQPDANPAQIQADDVTDPRPTARVINGDLFGIAGPVAASATQEDAGNVSRERAGEGVVATNVAQKPAADGGTATNVAQKPAGEGIPAAVTMNVAQKQAVDGGVATNVAREAAGEGMPAVDATRKPANEVNAKANGAPGSENAPLMPAEPMEKSHDEIPMALEAVVQIEEGEEAAGIAAELEATPVAIPAEAGPLPRRRSSPGKSVLPKGPSKRGRKSLKQVAAEAELIEIPTDEVLFSKQYYTMGEVSEMFRVNQSLLRFWETEFDILQPKKNKKGDRYFRPVDIKNLHLIYHLLRQRKYTIEGAKEFLKKNKKAEDRFEVIQRLQQIKSFLVEWRAQL
jgi:DNA-binding transcriptional MerR regulator